MGETLVSIVTPTLNQGAFIGAALDSVAAQTHAALQHIVIDGGSTDETLDILRGRSDPRLSWMSGSDDGMYDAINKGVERSSGEIVAYLNSDDAYLPWAVERAVAYLTANPATDLVFGDGVRINASTGGQQLRLFPPFHSVDLAHYGSLMQPSVFLRRRALERASGFDASLRFVADLDLWLRVAAFGKVEHLNEVLSVERDHTGALSVAQASAMAVEEGAMRARHGADLRTPEGQEGLRRARRHEKITARRSWIRFLAASTRRSATGSWGRFLTEGDVEVPLLRGLVGLMPGIGYQRRLTSVRSGTASSVLGR